MRKILFCILALLFVVPTISAQEYVSRYFHYDQQFDAADPFSIKATTVDGNDFRSMYLASGGAFGATRGGYVGVFGNENAGHGKVLVEAGNDAGDGGIYFKTGALQHFSVPLSITSLATLAYGLAVDTSPGVLIRSNKADGADDAYFQLTSGGAWGSTRGAGIQGLGDDYGGAGAGGELALMAGLGAAGNILFQTGGLTHLTIPQSISTAAALVFGLSGDSSPSLLIRSDKADGADDGLVQVTAGGVWGAARGAGIQWLGNDYGGAAAGGGILYEAGTGATAIHNFQIAGLSYWTIGAAGLLLSDATNGGSLQFGKNGSNIIFGSGVDQSETYLIRGNSVDGKDKTKVQICSGGDCNNTRGGYIYMAGNENGSSGQIGIIAGNVSNGNISLNATAGLISLITGVGERWQLTNAGIFNQNSTNGGSVVFNKSATGVSYTGAGTAPFIPSTNRETVSAAGSAQNDAVALTNVLYHRVDSADGSKGARLVLIANSSGVGSIQYVFNQSASALKLYPGSGEYINDVLNTAVSVTAYSHIACYVWDASNWYCN